jgi:predicted transcriptional regulator
MQEMLGVRSHGTDRYTSGRALEQTWRDASLKWAPTFSFAPPEDSNRDAAEAMAALDVGQLPAAENDRLVGMISDRDIATHRVVMGRGPDMPVRDVMTADVKYCFEDQEIDEIPRNMVDIQVRRCSIETST